MVTPQLITPSIKGPAQPADAGGSAPYTLAQMLKAYGTDQVTFSKLPIPPQFHRSLRNGKRCLGHALDRRDEGREFH
jgi:hypothetical protein